MSAFAATLKLDPCSYCGGPADQLDHIVARAMDGDDSFENLTATCAECNQSKGSRPLLAFLLHHNRPLTVGQQIKRGFGRRMRQRRLELGLTQSDLALTLDADLMAISRWERGASGPRGESAVRIAQALGVDLAWLYRDMDALVAA